VATIVAFDDALPRFSRESAVLEWRPSDGEFPYIDRRPARFIPPALGRFIPPVLGPASNAPIARLRHHGNKAHVR
jgi:hypothetical protein